MNVVIPMAGRGQRFVDAGYATPKMLIEVHGKTLLEWSVDSLPLELCTRLIFIMLEEHKATHGLEILILNKYAAYNPTFVYLDGVTRGQAETVLKSATYWNMDEALLIYNIDTAFESKQLSGKLAANTSDGILGAFIDTSDSSKYSYAKLNEEGWVTEVVEKEKISDYALTGLYHFADPEDFITVAEKNIDENNTVKDEFYVAPIYNQLLQQGKRFTIDVCDTTTILGTPEELEAFRKTKP